MSELTFTINLDAKLKEKPQKWLSTRDLLWHSQNRKVARFEPLPAAPAGESQSVSPSSTTFKCASRDALLKSLVCPSNTIVRVEHHSYKKYLISTTLRMDDTWVASYGRPGGPGFGEEGKERTVAETRPYFAEALALADARTAIDDRRKIISKSPPEERRGTVGRRRSSLRRKPSERSEPEGW